MVVLLAKGPRIALATCPGHPYDCDMKLRVLGPPEVYFGERRIVLGDFQQREFAAPLVNQLPLFAEVGQT